ncbi:MAG: hypothetical protein QW660_08110 [Candidatus Bathyarchaeia archaeon]
MFNAFSWYYLCRLAINKFGLPGCEYYLNTTYLISIMVSAIAGAVLFRSFEGLKALKIWILLGVFASLLIIPLPWWQSWKTFASISLLGASLGFFMPFCLDLLIKVTTIKNRGKIGGIILFATFSSVFFLYRSVSPLDPMLTGFSLALWRFWSLPLIFLVREKHFSEADAAAEKVQKFTSVLRNRTFLLYFMAWLMFSFIESFQTVIVSEKAAEFAFFVKTVEPYVAGFSAVVVGVILDYVGRKRVLVFIFVFLGMAYAVLGLFPYSWVSWFFYSVADGTATGLAFVLFMIVIWGEISTGKSVNFYAIGEVPFFFAESLSLVLKPFLVLIPQSSSFSLASFFLFIAVIPLVFAPETLPERIIRERELRNYIERAKRIKEKFTKS